MKILIDGFVFTCPEGFAGIQRYFHELLSRVSSENAVDIFLDRPAVTALPDGCRVRYRFEHFPVSRLNVGLRAWHKFQRTFAPTRFFEHDVFHSTFFTPSPNPIVPEVLTVHDMIPEQHATTMGEATAAHVAQKHARMRSARLIICPSEATAADVRKLYPELASKLRVIHHGAEHLHSPKTESAAASVADELPYLLYVGLRGAYKNFHSVLDAMETPFWPRGVCLRVAGKRFRDDEMQELEKRRLTGRVIDEGRVTDDRLEALYRDAMGLIVPSLCEGFGFPLLEAHSMKTPVLCSDIPVFHEVAGDAAVYFGPLNPRSIADAAALLLDPAQSFRLRESGRENLRRFSWGQCADLTLEVYRETSRSSPASSPRTRGED